MSNRPQPNLVEYYNTIQLWDLHTEMQIQVDLLQAIDNRLRTAEAQSKKEIFIANLLFAAEKIFNDLLTMPKSREAGMLFLKLDEIYTKELQMAISQTANVQLKRDIDKLISQFKNELAKYQTATYDDLKNATTKLKGWQQKIESAKKTRSEIPNWRYSYPRILKIMNYAIWGFGLYFKSFQLIFGYYVFAILFYVFDTLRFESHTRKLSKTLQTDTKLYNNEINQLLKGMDLNENYFEKQKLYINWFQELVK